jgi:hypothetical protein
MEWIFVVLYTIATMRHWNYIVKVKKGEEGWRNCFALASDFSMALITAKYRISSSSRKPRSCFE